MNAEEEKGCGDAVKSKKTLDNNHVETITSSWDFIERVIESISPLSSRKQQQPSLDVTSYHERNQEFLRQVEMERAKLVNKNTTTSKSKSKSKKKTPQQGLLWLPTRPPPGRSPGKFAVGRRKLKSIGNDDWSDDDCGGAEEGDMMLTSSGRSGDAVPSTVSRLDDEAFLAAMKRSKKHRHKKNKKHKKHSSKQQHHSADESSRQPKGVPTCEQRRQETEKCLNKLEEQEQEFLNRFEEAYEKEAQRDYSDDHQDLQKIEKKRKYREKEIKFIREYFTELENERESLLQKWKEEYIAQQNRIQDEESWHIADGLKSLQKKHIEPCLDSLSRFFSFAEVFIGNMPLAVGAVGLSWVTQGVIWFKFMEEVIDECVPVHFHSPKCTFPEFPGCFECETSNWWYQLALYHHFACHIVAFLCCMIFFLKVIIANRVVVDELSNPTTSTPCGVVCITVNVVFAGRGKFGETVVMLTSIFHFLLAFWFLYMAIFRFRLWPDPGWFPNTVGISYAAVKTWLYFDIPGRVLMGVCVVLFFSMFFISLIRVVTNQKLAAPVCFIQLSAPSITMYCMSLMAQPSPRGEEILLDSPELMRRFLMNHREYYIPVQHFMMVLSLIGMASALHSLRDRWPRFRLKEFSPAHFAFVFPILSHTNAVQAYRSGVNAFSTIPVGSPFKIALFNYWFICLVVGTIINLIFTVKFVYRLPKWTKLDVAEEVEPPSPSNTIVREIMSEESSGVHDVMHQPFVSPAVLEANEAGALIRVRRGTEDWERRGPYVRSRQVSALGFDPTMSEDELRRERAELLDWVAKNAPRTRNRTLSVPNGLKLDDGREIMYGTFAGDDGRHKRSSTLGTDHNMIV